MSARIFWGCALRERTAAARHTPNNKRAFIKWKKNHSCISNSNRERRRKIENNDGEHFSALVLIQLHKNTWLWTAMCIFVCVVHRLRAHISIYTYSFTKMRLSLWCSQSTGHAFCQSKERAAAVFYGFIVKIWFYIKYTEKYEYFLRQHSSGQQWGERSKE